jgi:hypothetical protein
VTFADLIEEVRALDSSVELTNMFGMQTMKIGGKVFAGQWQGRAAFKLPDDARAEAMAWAGAQQPQMGGRPMKQWVAVPERYDSEWLRLAEVAKDYVTTPQTGR